MLNPLRYRSYVYDDDTGLYYLQSRYYDPVTGRFLNADVYMDTQTGIFGTSMFAYCYNNPINYIDKDGYSPQPYGREKGGLSYILYNINEYVSETTFEQSKQLYFNCYAYALRRTSEQAYPCYYVSGQTNKNLKGKSYCDVYKLATLVLMDLQKLGRKGKNTKWLRFITKL